MNEMLSKIANNGKLNFLKQNPKTNNNNYICQTTQNSN